MMKRWFASAFLAIVAVSSLSWGAKFYGQLENAMMEKLGTDPTGFSSLEGRFYYNTGSSTPYFHNGSGWTSFASGDTSPTFLNVTIDNGSVAGGALVLVEDDDNGSSTVTIQAPANVTETYVLLVPPTSGNASEVLTTDGSGTTTWASVRSVPGYKENIGLSAATTTNANDSIKITGASAALSATNPGYITLTSATAGQLTTFKVVADVTILITGAHWGLGTFGDETDYSLSVYAINDAGTLKWGVTSIPGLSVILNGDESTTPSDINFVDEVLVTSAIGADSHALEIGWVKANFDDDGGAAADLWAMQTGTGDIRLGKSAEGVWKSFTPVSTWVTNAAHSGKWRKVGNMFEGHFYILAGGGVTAASLIFSMPSGLVISTADMPAPSFHAPYVGWAKDATGIAYGGVLMYASTTTMSAFYFFDQGAYEYIGAVNATTPTTWASGDYFNFFYAVPIVGWQ